MDTPPPCRWGHALAGPHRTLLLDKWYLKPKPIPLENRNHHMVDPLIIQVYRCQPSNLPQPRAVSSLFPPFYSKGVCWSCKLWSEEDVCLLFGIQYKSKIQNPKSKEPAWHCKLWSEEDVESALLHCRCSFTRPTFSITTDSHFATPEPEQGQSWQ